MLRRREGESKTWTEQRPNASQAPAYERHVSMPGSTRPDRKAENVTYPWETLQGEASNVQPISSAPGSSSYRASDGYLPDTIAWQGASQYPYGSQAIGNPSTGSKGNGRRGRKRKPLPLRVAGHVIRLALAIVLLVSIGYVSDSYLDWQDASTIRMPVTQGQGTNESAEDASGNGTSSQEGDSQPISYALILDGSRLAFYQSVTSVMSEGRISDPDDMSTWVPLPRDANIEMSDMATLWQLAVDDAPTLSVYATGGDSSYVRATPTAYCLDTPATRDEGAATISQLTRQSVEKADAVVRQARQDAGDDAERYVRSAFFQISRGATYTYDTAPAHYNDMVGSLVDGKSQCYGFSLAMKYALDKAGIPNFVGTGTAKGVAHAWNVVRLDGRWLVCDLTSGSATYHQPTLESLSMEDIEAVPPYADAMWSHCLMPQSSYLSGSDDVSMDDNGYALEKAVETREATRNGIPEANDENHPANSETATNAEDGNAGTSSSDGNGESDAGESTGGKGFPAALMEDIRGDLENRSVLEAIGTVIDKSGKGWQSLAGYAERLLRATLARVHAGGGGNRS